jgi:hypothetical protein
MMFKDAWILIFTKTLQNSRVTLSPSNEVPCSLSHRLNVIISAICLKGLQVDRVDRAKFYQELQTLMASNYRIAENVKIPKLSKNKALRFLNESLKLSRFRQLSISSTSEL